MDLETKEKKKIFIAAERSQQGNLTLWMERKFKVEAQECASHMSAQLVKKHRDSILTKLGLEIQEVVKTVIQRDNVPLHSDKVEIADASKIEIDQFIDVKELYEMRKDDFSVALDYVLAPHWTDNSFFYTNFVSEQREDKLQEILVLLVM